MGDRVAGAHTDLHSDQGARQGEHPGRSRDPIIKVHDIAWLEFEKPDLVRAEAFWGAFGFSTVVRTDDELYLQSHHRRHHHTRAHPGPGRFGQPQFLGVDAGQRMAHLAIPPA
jgi:hypothetical protein